MFDRKSRLLVVLAAIAALVGLLATQMMPSARDAEGGDQARAALAKTMASVAERWPKLAHISTESVAEKLGSNDQVVFDARSPEEFAVSHLPGAIHVAPDTTAADFIAAHGSKLDGKTVVFYCSVGVRSSTLATRVGPAVANHGGTRVADMAGGIFAWHNEGRPLRDGNGKTDAVHSYDKWWGRLIAEPEKSRTTPKE